MTLAVTLACGGVANAQTNTWTGTTSGVLNVSGNYTFLNGGSVASDGNPSALYLFGNNAANRYSLTNSAELKANRFEFSGTNSYTIANTAQFNFIGAGGGITQSSSANQTISGGIKVSDGPFTLGGNGTGLVTLSGTNNDYGGKGVTKSGSSAFLITTAITSPGTVTISGGTLAFSGTGNLASAYLLRGGVVAASGTFARTVGTGATSVNFAAGSNGGFAAYGGALNVTTALGTWGTTASSLTATSQLILGSSIADNVVTLSAALGLGTAARTIQLVDNANSANDSAAISGILSGVLGGLNLTGTGTLVLSGVNTYTGVTTIGSGVTLSVATIGNGGVAGNLGQAAVAATNLLFNGGTLRYTGATASTNRNFTLGAATTSAIHVSTALTVLTLTGASATTTGIINKTGDGVLTLSAANTHTGGTILTTGTLRATTNAGALGNGTLTLSGGILDLVNDTGLAFGRNTTITANTQINSRRTNTGAGVTHSLGTLAIGAQTLTTGTDATVTSGTAGVTFGTTTLSATGTTFTANASTLLTLGAITGTNTGFTVNGAGNTNIGGVIGTGTGTLTKAGAGVLTLSAGNTYSGATTISAGTLQIGAANTTGSLSASSAITNNSALSFNRSNTLTQGTDFGTISGSGTLTQAGSGILVLSSANSYSGTTTISTGALNLRNATGLGTTAGGTSVSTGAALQLQGDITVGAEALTLSGTGTDATGALLNVSGTNTYGGAITRNAASTIGSTAGTLTLSGTMGGNFDTTFAGAGNIIGSGVISGISGITKTGAVVLTLSAGNTYSGATTISTGVLNLRNATGLGTTAGGTSVSTGAALQLQGDITVGAEALTLSGTGTDSTGALLNVSGTNTYGGAITRNAASTIGSIAGTLTLSGTMGGNFDTTFAGAGNIIGSGVISGTSGITKTGAGVLTLSAGNTHTGGTVLNTGTLRATTNAGALGNGTLTLSGGILDFVNDTGLAFGRNTTVTADTQINSRRASAGAGVTHSLGTLAIGAQTLTVGTDATVTTGTAGVTFGATNLTTSGTTFTANASTLLTLGAITGTNTGFTVNGQGDTNISGVIGTGTGNLTKAGGGNLTLLATNTFSGATAIDAGALQVGDGGTTGTLGGGSVAIASGASLRFNRSNDLTVANVLSGAGTVTKLGANALTLSGTNTFTGGTSINSGSVRIAADANLGTGNITLAGGTLAATETFTLGSARVISLTANSMLDVAAAKTLTFDGDFSGTGDLNKTGDGILILGGTSTYTGATKITDGRLVVNGNISTSEVTTVSSTGILSGSGTLGAVSIESTGTHSPGNSPGIVNTGNYNMAGSLIIEVVSEVLGTGYDQVNVTGSVNLSGTLNINFSGGVFVDGDLLFILLNDGTDAVTGTLADLAQGDIVTSFGGYDWQISYSANGDSGGDPSFIGGNDIALIAVPEPSSALLGGLASVLLLLRRRR